MIERIINEPVRPRELKDNTYLSEYDLQTLSEDASYGAEILDHHPTIFLRPDDRTSPDNPTYARANEEGVSYIGLITKYGSHETQTPATIAEPRIPIRVVSREAKPIREMGAEEFGKAYKTIHDAPSAVLWLQQKYPNRSFTADSVVTVYRIEYV